jgi:Flp pilus assembly protein TadD
MKIRAAGAAILCLAIVLTAGPALARKKGPSLSELQENVQKNPQNPRTHYMLGIKYEINGDQAKAMTAYQEALRLKGDYAEALFRMGEIKYAQGNLAAAAKDLQAALKSKPDYPEARTALGAVKGRQGLALINQGDLTAAERKFREALQDNPNDHTALNNLGVALGQMGRWGEAVAAFQRASDLDPDNPQTQYNLGVAYFADGERETAMKQYIAMTSRNPEVATELYQFMLANQNLEVPGFSPKFKSTLPSGPFPPTFPGPEMGEGIPGPVD